MQINFSPNVRPNFETSPSSARKIIFSKILENIELNIESADFFNETANDSKSIESCVILIKASRDGNHSFRCLHVIILRIFRESKRAQLWLDNMYAHLNAL